MSSDSTPCVGINGEDGLYFEWTYLDSDCDKEKKFQFQVSTSKYIWSGDYLKIDYTSNNNLNWGLCSNGVVSVLNSQMPLISLGSLNNTASLKYNTNYYWRVRVYDEHGTASDPWTYFGNNSTRVSFKINGYPSPYPEFMSTPDSLSVNFTNVSSCYSSNDSCSYKWSFDCSPLTLLCSGVDITTNSVENVSHTYGAKGEYTAKLQACDASGVCCDTYHTVNVENDGADSPKWKEISPF